MTPTWNGIMQGLGFSTLETTLIQMPPGAVQLVMCPIAWYNSFTLKRYGVAPSEEGLYFEE
jgi:hypothetical protein